MNKLRKLYKRLNRNYQAEFLHRIALRYFKNCSILIDIGCGTGSFMDVSKNKNIIGVDYNEESLDICHSKGYTVMKAKATELPLKDESVDGVYCSHVIEHLYPEDAYKLLIEIDRVLKRGGVFILCSPVLYGGGKDAGFYKDFTHIKPYYPEPIIKYMCSGEESEQKTFPSFKNRYKVISLRWRRKAILSSYHSPRIILQPLRLLLNYLYQFGIKSFKVDGYMLVMKKC